MRRSMRTLIRLVGLILPLALAMPAAADKSYAVVMSLKAGVTGGQMTGVTPSFDSGWNDSTKTCNFVNKELWLLFDDNASEWLEVGVTDGKMEDAKSKVKCGSVTVSSWTGNFSAYQLCTTSSDCQYHEYPFDASGGIGTTHTYEIVKTDNDWITYADSKALLIIKGSAKVSGTQLHIGMEGNGTPPFSFGDTTSTSAHKQRVGTTWSDWCVGTCQVVNQNGWTAKFGTKSSSTDYTTATYKDN